MAANKVIGLYESVNNETIYGELQQHLYLLIRRYRDETTGREVHVFNPYIPSPDCPVHPILWHEKIIHIMRKCVIKTTGQCMCWCSILNVLYISVRMSGLRKSTTTVSNVDLFAIIENNMLILKAGRKLCIFKGVVSDNLSECNRIFKISLMTPILLTYPVGVHGWFPVSKSGNVDTCKEYL